MANMLYNGVELPALPETNQTYKYAIIVRAASAEKYYLRYCNYEVVFNNQLYCKGGGYEWNYNLENGEWVYTGESYRNSGNSMYGDIVVVWTNTDILAVDDGSVYFAGSDPVDPNAPVTTYDKTVFLSGLAMGLCGKGNPTFEGSDTFSKGYLVGAELRAKRVLPVAYLYNGVELPKLPKTDLQYAVLTHHEAYHYEGFGQVIDTPECYQLSVLAEPFYAETSTSGTTYVRSHPSAKYQKWECKAPDFSRWELASEGNWWVVSYDDVLWTNHNVFFGELADTVEVNVVYTDELFMAKSPDPVPVYE